VVPGVPAWVVVPQRMQIRFVVASSFLLRHCHHPHPWRRFFLVDFGALFVGGAAVDGTCFGAAMSRVVVTTTAAMVG